MLVKVAIIGPESTGKTKLAEELAKHFNADWVPEYAREYVENLSEPYTYKDVCNIALKQIEEEDYYKTVTNTKMVFFDTDLIITKVWFEYCYQEVPSFVEERIQQGVVDLYLLCYHDIEWYPDKVREHGVDREFFYRWYKKEIEKTGKPYYVVTGNGSKRTENAINAINDFVKNI